MFWHCGSTYSSNRIRLQPTELEKLVHSSLYTTTFISNWKQLQNLLYWVSVRSLLCINGNCKEKLPLKQVNLSNYGWNFQKWDSRKSRRIELQPVNESNSPSSCRSECRMSEKRTNSEPPLQRYWGRPKSGASPRSPSSKRPQTKWLMTVRV